MRGDGERRLAGGLRRRLAAFLREIAARLSTDRGGNRGLDRWRERFPGAPDHWLEIVKRAVPGLVDAPAHGARQSKPLTAKGRVSAPADLATEQPPPRGRGTSGEAGIPIVARPVVRFAAAKEKPPERALRAIREEGQTPRKADRRTPRPSLFAPIPLLRARPPSHPGASSPEERPPPRAASDVRAPMANAPRLAVAVELEPSPLRAEQRGAQRSASSERGAADLDSRRADKRAPAGPRRTARRFSDDGAGQPGHSPWPAIDRWPARDAVSVRYANEAKADRLPSRTGPHAGGEADFPALSAGAGEQPRTDAESVPSWPELPAVPQPAYEGRGEAAGAARLRRLIADQEERGWSGSRS